MSLYTESPVLSDDDRAERRACGCYFDAPCDCDRGYYSSEYAHDDHYDDYDHSDYEREVCGGTPEDCPFGGCSDCDGDLTESAFEGGEDAHLDGMWEM